MALPLPLIDTAPFWQALTPAELGAITGVLPEPGDLDFTEGWTLAVFSVAGPDHARHACWGWVRDAFAVMEKCVGEATAGTLTHLPTGYAIAHFRDAEAAAEAAAIIAPLALDWAAVTPETAHTLGVPAAMGAAGYRRHVIVSGSHVEVILVREPLQ